MSTCGYVYMNSGISGDREGVRSPRAGVLGSCVLQDLRVWSSVWVLWKRKSHQSQPLSPCSSPAGLIYTPSGKGATSFGPWKLSKVMGKVHILQVYRKKKK